MNSQGAYIGLIDCNNFFVSCECIFEPGLMGRPVGVLSNNDGCFIARSNELKALGVAMGAPRFKVKDIIDRHKVVVRSANFSLYSDISVRVMRILKKTFPRVEVYSIDEAFIYFSKNSAQEVLEEGRAIRKRLYQWLGIPVSIGIAKTKTLAKVACHLCKQNKELGGVHLLESKEQIERSLREFEPGNIWGIGRQKAKFLNSKSIETAYDFLQLSEDWVKKNLSITGLRTLLELRGIPCLAFEDMAQNNKSILRSRSFCKPKTEVEDIAQAVAYHATRAAEVLRFQDSVTFSIGVFVRTNRHSSGPQYSQSAIEHFFSATDYTPDILKGARMALAKIFKPGYRYNKAGVYFPQVIPKAGSQLNLFKPHKNLHDQENLMQVFDSINRKYGSKSLFYAAAGTRNTWQSRGDQMSAAFTTNWDELPVVR